MYGGGGGFDRRESNVSFLATHFIPHGATRVCARRTHERLVGWREKLKQSHVFECVVEVVNVGGVLGQGKSYIS